MTTEVIRRRTYGKSVADSEPVIGIACAGPAGDMNLRGDYIRVIRGRGHRDEQLNDYAGIVTDLPLEELFPEGIRHAEIPAIVSAGDMDFIHNGDILRLDFGKGYIQSLYRINSAHNAIFATDQCNSNCLMCSQPPKDIDDSHLIAEHLRLVSLIPKNTEHLGITGGEPTLLGEGLFRILEACRDTLPNTRLHMLTNGRLFYYRSLAQRLAYVNHHGLMLGVPLYSDLAHHHDYVVQAKGSFDQTMVGLHNLALYNQPVEIRIVIHKQTYERLPRFAQFIYRNYPVARHVAFMGLELMGYTKPNLNILWIDPVDYQDQLEEAITYLSWAGMHVSIYNHPLCILRKSLWPYARKSISDYKNIYLDECHNCGAVEQCGGLFKSAERTHSEHIAPIPSSDCIHINLPLL